MEQLNPKLSTRSFRALLTLDFMEKENHLPYFLYLSAFLYFIFIGFKIWTKPKANVPSSRLPPGPPILPLIGNLHLLFTKTPHASFARLAKKYGPVMKLKLGEVPTVVISSPEAAKEVMKTQDHNFAVRPYLYAAELLTYNFQDLIFSRGDYARQIRKICALELLSVRRVQSFSPSREEELSNFVRAISSNAGKPINMKSMLRSSSLNIVSRIAFGGRCKHTEEFKELLPGVAEMLGGLNIVDVYPSVKLLHLINAKRPKIKSFLKKLDEVLESIIREHRIEKSTLGEGEDRGGDNLVHVLLDVQDHRSHEFSLSTTGVKAILMSIFSGAGDTSANVAEWAMAEMMKNPKIMEQAQAEVRAVFAGKGDVNEAGLQHLKYLDLVIKETLRVHPVAPLLIPRECQESCEVNGYLIPAKTRIIINGWALSRDESYWVEAEKFRPERFHDNPINHNGTDFNYLPFGSGRRQCLGMNFGMTATKFTLAKLLYHFDWQLPNGMKPEDLDMTDAVCGAVLEKKEDLCLVPTPYQSASASR